MSGPEVFRADVVRRLFQVTRRVSSSTDPASLLEEIVHGVVEGLGYGVAAISRVEGDELVITAVSGPEDVRRHLLGRRNPAERVLLQEFAMADQWGILRFVPHDRLPPEVAETGWAPDLEPGDAEDDWHPYDTLYAPLYSAEGVLLGNMAVDMPPDNKIPNQQQRELLQMFVVQAGLAMASAQRQEQLSKQVRLGQALKTVALTGSGGDLGDTLRAAVEELADALGASQVTVRCFPDSVEDPVEHSAGHPLDARAPAGIVEFIRRDLTRLSETGRLRPRQIGPGNVEEFPEAGDRITAHMHNNGWETCWIVPVGVAPEVLGYLVAMPETAVGFDEDEVDTLADAGRELGRLVRDTRLRERERRLVAELRELDRYKGELIATISHELKTPLTSIIGHTELLADAEVAPASVSAISRNAARLDRLVTNLLNFSRTQSRREMERAQLDLVDLCHSTLELLRIQADNAGVVLDLVVPEEPVHVVGDPDELSRAVDNLASNAVKYTPRGGQVVITVRKAGDHGEVVVTDTGLGISQQDQLHLFSAFHRSSNPDALTIPGTGLGLAISRTIAESHGGEITVDSELGRGSTFVLRVPLA